MMSCYWCFVLVFGCDCCLLFAWLFVVCTLGDSSLS